MGNSRAELLIVRRIPLDVVDTTVKEISNGAYKSRNRRSRVIRQLVRLGARSGIDDKRPVREQAVALLVELVIPCQLVLDKWQPLLDRVAVDGLVQDDLVGEFVGRVL